MMYVQIRCRTKTKQFKEEKMKTVRKVLSIVMLLALVLSMTAITAHADNSKVVKLAFTDPATLTVGDMTIYHPSYAAMLAFKGAFEKGTGNEYSVELYPNGVLGDAASTMEQMLSGTLTGSTPADGALSAFAPDIQVLSIPYLFENPVVGYDVMDGEFGQALIEKIAAETGFRIIASYDNGGYRNFTNSKREIRSAEDMKGLNIRVMDSPVYLEMVHSFGAAATPVAFMELYSALQTGVVDGQENSAVTTLGASLDEVQPYCTLDGHLLGWAFLTISESWYQSLDADTKAAVDEAGREATIAARGTCRYAEALAINTLTEAGVQVYSPSAEELETFKISQEPVIEYLKTIVDPTLIDGLFAAIEGAEVAAVSADAAVAATANQGGNSMNTILIVAVAVLAVLCAYLAFGKKSKKPETEEK